MDLTPEQRTEKYASNYAAVKKEVDEILTARLAEEIGGEEVLNEICQRAVGRIIDGVDLEVAIREAIEQIELGLGKGL